MLLSKVLRCTPALLLAVSGAGLVAAGPATAEERTCRGTIAAVTLDNLRVPQGATCTLNGTRLQGTIKVEGGATLRANAVRVVGNVQAEGARSVTVLDSRVGGSIQLVQGGAANVRRNIVNADILFDDNSRALASVNNTIGGNLQAFQNTGGVAVSRNRIDGNLQCKENAPPPTGGGNVVQGNKEDQCRGL
jgi:hypothetical protein